MLTSKVNMQHGETLQHKFCREITSQVQDGTVYFGGMWLPTPDTPQTIGICCGE